MHYIFEGELRELGYGALSKKFKKSNSKNARVARSARNMRHGDMWDNGRGYIGPVPLDDDDDAQQIYIDLQRRFTSRNVIAEVVERMVDALLSQSPNWIIYDKKNVLSRSIQRVAEREKLQKRLEVINRNILSLISGVSTGDTDQIMSIIDNSPEDEPDIGDEQAESSTPIDSKIAMAELLISEIWTTYNLKEVIETTFDDFLTTGEGKTRIRFSSKLKYYSPAEGDNEYEKMLSVMKYIKVENVDSDSAKILDDDGEKISIAKLEKPDGSSGGIEISFVDDKSNNTYIVLIDKDSERTKTEVSAETDVQMESEEQTASEAVEKARQAGDISSPLFLDGNILVDEMTGPAYVTESMLQNNRSLNLDLSLAAGILVESGYQEMVTTNVDFGTANSNVPGKTGSQKKKISLKRGPTTTTNLVGAKSVDQYGTIHYENPSVTFKDPAPLDTFDAGENLFYRQILHEARQSFVLASKDYNVSGESKIQSRQDFIKKAYKYKPKVDKHGTWLGTTLLHLIAAAAGYNGYFEGIGFMFDSRVTSGDLSTDEKNAIILQQEKGLIDRESAMVKLGVEDPILTLDRVRMDQAETLEYLIKKKAAEMLFSEKPGPKEDEIVTPEEESVRSKNNRNVNAIKRKKIPDSI